MGRASGLLSKKANDILVTAFPDSARAHQTMGENYFVLRQMPQAEKEYLEAIRQRPDLPDVHMELGLVYAGSAEWTKAEEVFRTEVKLQPGKAEAFYRLGFALLQQGKGREARLELQHADKLQPDMPETLYSLGKAASLEGDTALAEKSWLHLLSIEKDSSLSAQAHFGLAALYQKRETRRKPNKKCRNTSVCRPSQPTPELRSHSAPQSLNLHTSKIGWTDGWPGAEADVLSAA